MSFLGGLGSVIGGVAGLFGSSSSSKINKQNLALQKENLEWQKQSQHTTWEREDNAVARRVADLKASGLSPVLAAGSAAETGAPIKTEAPQLSDSHVDMRTKSIQAMTDAFGIMERIKGLQTQDAIISKTHADRDLAISQQQRTQVETDRLNKMTEPQLEVMRQNILSQVAKRKHMTRQQAEILARIANMQHNLNIARTTMSPVGQDLSWQKLVGRAGQPWLDRLGKTGDAVDKTLRFGIDKAYDAARGLLQQGSSIFNSMRGK